MVLESKKNKLLMNVLKIMPLSVFFFPFFFFIQNHVIQNTSYLAIHSLPGAQIKSFQSFLLKGQSISQRYQRKSSHVVTTSIPRDTVTLLSSHPGLSHFPLTLWPSQEKEDFLQSQKEDILQR